MEYLLWGIEWAVVQRGLIDAPTYKSKKDDKDEKGRTKKKINTADDLKSFFKNIDR